MLLGGLWHGAGWNFLIWGALHGSYLVVYHGVNDLAPSLASRLAHLRLLNWAMTIFAVVVAWVFFRAVTWHGAVTMLRAMLLPDLTPGGATSGWVAVASASALAIGGCSALQVANGAEIAIARRPEHLPPCPDWGRMPARMLTHPVTVACLFLACMWQVTVSGAGEFLYFNF